MTDLSDEQIVEALKSQPKLLTITQGTSQDLTGWPLSMLTPSRYFHRCPRACGAHLFFGEEALPQDPCGR